MSIDNVFFNNTSSTHGPALSFASFFFLCYVLFFFFFNKFGLAWGLHSLKYDL